jgi:hypothetical protein
MNKFNRRQILRGAGVALCLPWLESRAARAASGRRRYISLYFPNGTAEFWRPAQAGTGAAWKLSPILEPLAALKKHVTVLSGISNYSPFGLPDGPAGRLPVNPAHSGLCASTFTSAPPSDASGKRVSSGNSGVNSGISVDQVIANTLAGQTPLPSIQVGLTTRESYADNLPGQHSRSISWKSPSQPLYKTINPQAVFDRLVAGGGGADMNVAPADALEAKKRAALRKSALDAVLGNANHLRTALGRSDQQRMDEFLTSVRALEKRVAEPEMKLAPAECKGVARPGFAAAVGQTPPGYNRGEHANVMIDLVVMALQCDITRVVSFMLDDARSDYVYSFLKLRNFTDAGSTPGTATIGGYHDLSHAGDKNSGYATIGYWNTEKAAQLAGRLAALPDEDGASILDNTVITFCSGMKGQNHDARNLPVAVIGSGGGVLKTDQHVLYPSDQRLADVHLTILQKVFAINTPKFGASKGILPSMLA